jgi:hypothetical protein
VALFSDLDWLILLGVGAFLLFGQGNGAALRQLGRYYARLNRLKRELLGDLARAADLPLPDGRTPTTIRAALIGWTEPGPGRTSGIPVAVSAPPPSVHPVYSGPVSPGSAGIGPETWSIALPRLDSRGGRP